MLMRKLLILVTIIAAGLLVAAGQAAGKAEAEEPGAGIGGGGMTATLLFLDLEKLNQVLEANGYGPLNNMVFTRTLPPAPASGLKGGADARANAVR